MKKLIKSESPLDCDVLLNSYSSSFKKRATSKAVKVERSFNVSPDLHLYHFQESFENSQIFFPLSTLELKRKPSKTSWYTISRGILFFTHIKFLNSVFQQKNAMKFFTTNKQQTTNKVTTTLTISQIFINLSTSTRETRISTNHLSLET